MANAADPINGSGRFDCARDIHPSGSHLFLAVHSAHHETVD